MPSPSDEPRVVILAAGASRRLGEPKALARIGTQTVLEHLIAAASLFGPPLVVTGAHHPEIARFAEHLQTPLELAENPRWAEGRTGSVAVAARRCPGRALLVAPCDVPLVPRAVFEALRQAWAEAGGPETGWLAPSAPDREGISRPGHPILLGAALARAVHDAPPDRPLRTIRRSADPLWTVPVCSPAIHDDLDEPGDLEALRHRN